VVPVIRLSIYANVVQIDVKQMQGDWQQKAGQNAGAGDHE